MSLDILEAAQRGIGLVLVLVLLLLGWFALKIGYRVAKPSVAKAFRRWPIFWLVLVGVATAIAMLVVGDMAEDAREEQRQKALTEHILRNSKGPIEAPKWIEPPGSR